MLEIFTEMNWGKKKHLETLQHLSREQGLMRLMMKGYLLSWRIVHVHSHFLIGLTKNKKMEGKERQLI